MIVSLIPRPDFVPVPRIEIRLEEELFSWDGGGADGGGTDELDGGDAGTGGAGFDAGLSTTVSIDLPEGTNRVTFWRECEGRSMRVSGAITRVFNGGFSWQDMEAGFDTDSTYSVECFADDLSVGTFPLGSTTLPWTGEGTDCLIQQPLDPTLNAVVVNLAGSAESITREAGGGLVSPEGSTYPNLIGFGPRRAATNVPLSFAAPSRDVARKVWGTFGTESLPQMPVWLVRTHAGLLPRVFFAHVASIDESDVDLFNGGGWSRFSTVVSEIARPAPSLVVAPLSYDDIDVSFDSYTDMDAAFSSYSARDSAYEYAGAAG